MTNEDILKLAREAAASKGHTLKDVPEQATVEFIETFAHAVIKANEAKLIAGAGEPVCNRVHPFDYGIGHEGVYAVTHLSQQVAAWERKGWNVEPLYTASQVAGAVAKAKQEYQDNVNSFAAGASLRKERIATLESTLKVALECIEGVVRGDYDGNGQDVSDQIKEVLK